MIKGVKIKPQSFHAKNEVKFHVKVKNIGNEYAASGFTTTS